MNTRIKELAGRRKLVLSLAVTVAMAGAIWFSAMGGAGIASADGGVDVGSSQSNLEQQYNPQHQPATCFFAIPC